MLFNPDPHKPAQEVLLSKKKKVFIHPVLIILRWRKRIMKSILVHFLMGKSLLNITLTNRFAKLIKAYQQQKTKACFTAKIFTHYLQSIFEASDKLHRYIL